MLYFVYNIVEILDHVLTLVHFWKIVFSSVHAGFISYIAIFIHYFTLILISSYLKFILNISMILFPYPT